MTDDLPLPARIGQDLRDYGAAFSALGRVFADRLQLHTSDANALIHVIEAEERGEPISAARLAARIGLSPAATSALLTRRGRGGHVAGQHSAPDRRIVPLRSTESVPRRVDEFFEPLGARLDALIADHPPEFLERL